MTRAPIPAFALAPAAFLLSVSGARPVPSEAPVAVSPGATVDTAIASTDRCPTFSWGRFEGAAAYELVVYRVTAEQGLEPELLLSQQVDGSALVWTPSFERCPEHAGRYAWSVRAITPEGASGWSAPLFFDVSEPTDQELAWALEVVRRRLGEETRDRAPVVPWVRPTGGVHERGPRLPTKIASAGVAAGTPDANVKVAGEVRTIDPGNPTGPARLWGKGRMDAEVYGRVTPLGVRPCVNGSIRYGLSTVAVDWGSAADACPAGTWVCRLDEILGCDTVRPDVFADGFQCDGSAADAPPDEHWAWVANVADQDTAGTIRVENGNTTARSTCWTLPVWCCWSAPLGD